MAGIEEPEVRVRLAPSPTGHLHIGTARTALFNWLFARQNDGIFVIRVEDTDKERSKKEYEDELLEGLSWLGLDWDEGPMLSDKRPAFAQKGGLRTGRHATSDKGAYGPYRQSERGAIYKKYLEKLVDEKKAYFCYCNKEDLEAERTSMITQGLPPKYAGHCRNLSGPPAGRSPTSIRFKMPEAQVEFKDMIRGAIRFDAGLFGDMVIARDVDSPLFLFAVTVDDFEMRISHVIRGEDHIANTPKQVLLQKALGFTEPAYAHLPLILSSDRSKLSKRYAETSLLSYRDEGYLPEAMMNFLALLGWHPQGDEEILPSEVLIKEFNIKRVQKGGAILNEEKLAWLNAQHMKRLPVEALIERLRAYARTSETYSSFFHDEAFVKKVLSAERERLTNVKDFFELARFFFELPEYDAPLLIWKDSSQDTTKSALQAILHILEKLPEKGYEREQLRGTLEEFFEERGKGYVLWPLRVAVSGRAASPDPLTIMEVLGKQESLARVRHAIQKLA